MLSETGFGRTKMAKEIASIRAVARAQIDSHLDGYLQAGELLARAAPASVITCARGSSDHAAMYLKYLVELRLGLPVCSMGPSIASIYGAGLRVSGMALIAISQSGQSRDLCALANAASDAGALTLSLINETDSPLAAQSEHALPIGAGREVAVAATKSFTSSLIACAALVAGWTADNELVEALRRLPDDLDAAVGTDWPDAIASFVPSKTALILSRGPGVAIAGEAALKLKETCHLHAEAYSSAEVLHGPLTLASDTLRVLSFGSRDAARGSILEAEQRFSKGGAQVFSASDSSSESSSEASDIIRLPIVPAAHPLLDPISQIASFYRFAERLSAELGIDPDNPKHLSKVTVTV